VEGVAMGFDPNDPVYSGTPADIDGILKRNARLAGYIGDRFRTGPQIAAQGKFVQDSTDSNFDSAFKNVYGDSPQKSIQGFYDYNKKIIHVRPAAVSGTALHEAIHSLASPGFYRFLQDVAQKVSQRLVGVLSEGVTAFFTDCVLREEHFSDFVDAYASQKEKAKTLIVDTLKPDGFNVIACFNFKFHITPLISKLGLTLQDYGKLGNQGLLEIAKRLDAAL
jgi:hypothetical protein